MEAQLKALGHEEERWRDLLLCTTEGQAFTFIITKIGESDGKISYAECKSKILEQFCGSDYQRTLEMKLRSFHFRRGMSISKFVTDLRNIIHELYNIKDEKAVDLIAISHVTTSLYGVQRAYTCFTIIGNSLFGGHPRTHSKQTDTAFFQSGNSGGI